MQNTAAKHVALFDLGLLRTVELEHNKIRKSSYKIINK